MTQHAEALLERIEEGRRQACFTRVQVATELRDAVRIFNAQPISLSAIDALRARIEIAADRLAPLHSGRVDDEDAA